MAPKTTGLLLSFKSKGAEVLDSGIMNAHTTKSYNSYDWQPPDDS